MEDNSSYTYVYEKNDDSAKPERSLKIIFAGVIVALAVLAIALGIYFGVRSGKADEPETTVPVIETATTLPAVKSPYNTGLYSVNSSTGIKFRKEPSSSADTILTIDYKIELEITEIDFDENAESDDYMYWGKTSFKGHTGWVSMKYMQKAYSDNVITPEDISTTEATTGENESATAAPEESTTMLVLTPPEETTSEQTSSEEITSAQSSSKYTPGDYKISTGGSTLSFRKGAGTGFETVFSLNDGEKLSIVEIVDTGDSNKTLQYWGKATYKGQTGYVCMTYLTRVN